MLVLARKVGEQILIGDDIVITLCNLRSRHVAVIGIDAPKEVRITRKEITTEDRHEEER